MVKIVIGHKSGKTKQVEFEDNKVLTGKKIGDTFKGELIDMAGYEFTITGGSNAAGFPMRRDVDSSSKQSILLVQGIGLRKAHRDGLRRRKTVAGNTINIKTAQVNVMVTKEGSTPLFEVSGSETSDTAETDVSTEPKAEEVSEEAPKEE